MLNRSRRTGTVSAKPLPDATCWNSADAGPGAKQGTGKAAIISQPPRSSWERSQREGGTAVPRARVDACVACFTASVLSRSLQQSSSATYHTLVRGEGVQVSVKLVVGASKLMAASLNGKDEFYVTKLAEQLSQSVARQKNR